ncbi:SDR family oxidoreductase [Candidatus Poriferisodalis sp.]|uniref:SDR family oxidoreductase n=1 Tax=Candidatus Poriferisodalis sp. TaxID=3101277 RepID=UPI003AF4EB1E
MRFGGKRVIVTGGASGFGRAISQGFAGRGAQVMVTDIDIDGAEAVAADLDGALTFRLDVTDEDAHAELAQLMTDTWGGIDIVATNAGFSHRAGYTLNVPTDEFDLMWAVNTRSIYFAVKHFTPHMGPGSSIVSTASIGGKRPRKGFTPYNASKAAAIILTRGLAEEFAPDIRINCVAPVASETAFFVRATGSDTLPDPLKQSIIDGIPMGRMTDPTDVANAVMFLASDEASFLTGVCLDVDGGRSIS